LVLNNNRSLIHSSKGNIIMKHTKMKGFTSIKSDDFEGKAVDIVDGDEVGWGHHQPPDFINVKSFILSPKQ
jgi:hypothetical protein